MNSPRQPSARRLIAALLLVLYGSSGLLGYGLHSLWHQHHGFHACSGHGVGHSGCDGCHCHSFCVESVLVAQADQSRLIVQEDCSICAFLAQAQTPQFRFAFAQYVSELGHELPVSESIAPLFIPANHLARGPPLC